MRIGTFPAARPPLPPPRERRRTVAESPRTVSAFDRHIGQEDASGERMGGRVGGIYKGGTSHWRYWCRRRMMTVGRAPRSVSLFTRSRRARTRPIRYDRAPPRWQTIALSHLLPSSSSASSPVLTDDRWPSAQLTGRPARARASVRSSVIFGKQRSQIHTVDRRPTTQLERLGGAGGDLQDQSITSQNTVPPPAQHHGRPGGCREDFRLKRSRPSAAKLARVEIENSQSGVG